METASETLGAVAAAPIRNYNDYILSMYKGLDEKLWFAGMLPEDVTVVADFGCAGGDLAAALLWGDTFTDAVLYDNDPQMVALCKSTGFREVSEHFGMFQARIERHHAMGHKSCLVLSSVIHEVLSQGVTWQNFWAATSALRCDYIAIRDMAVSQDLLPSDRDSLEQRIKARWPEDAEREAAENYFPVTVECMLNTCTIGSGYKLRHMDHHTLPLYAAEWGLTTPTHIKMLLKRTT